MSCGQEEKETSSREIKMPQSSGEGCNKVIPKQSLSPEKKNNGENIPPQNSATVCGTVRLTPVAIQIGKKNKIKYYNRLPLLHN